MYYQLAVITGIPNLPQFFHLEKGVNNIHLAAALIKYRQSPPNSKTMTSTQYAAHKC